MFILLGIVITVILFFVLVGLGSIGILITIAIAVLYFLSIILAFNVANTIFNTALFVYSDTGKILEGYNRETMQNAFKPKEMSNI